MRERIAPNQIPPLSPEAIATKIDMVIRELEQLRNMVVNPPSKEPETDMSPSCGPCRAGI